MIKLILKNIDGSQSTQNISKDISLDTSLGQELYFINLDGLEYSINLVEDEKSIELVFINNGIEQKILIHNMTDLIKTSEQLTLKESKSVLGIINDQEGLNELNNTALNDDFKSDNVIRALKELLEESPQGEDITNSIIINSFSSLLENLGASAAGGDGAGDGSFFLGNQVNPFSLNNNIQGRGRGSDFSDERSFGTSTAEDNLNDNPVAVDDIISVNEDASATVIDVLANDSDLDGDTIRVDSVTQPSNGIVTLVNGVVKYIPNANYNGPDSFTYTISDQNGGTNTATVNITVTSDNDNPVAVDDIISVNEDASATVIDVLENDSDLDGDTIRVDSVTQPSNGIVTLVNGVVKYIPNANYNGPDSFTYTISDQNGGTNTATVNITVTSDNDNPVAVDDIISVNEDASATVIDVLANDSDLDGDTIRVDSVTQPSNGIVTLVNGVVKYIPNANYNGPDSFTYTISDQNGGTNTATVNITVTSDNDNPVAVDDIISVNEDASATVIDVLANDSDLDGDTIRVDSVTQPSNGIVTLVNGVVKYIPNANYNGPDSFTYTISDQNGGTNTATVNITVTSDNDNPVAVDDIISVNEDASATVIDVLANDSDLDGDTIRVDSVTQPSNGIVTLVNGVVKYIPNANYNGPDSFTYTISDQNGGTNTATVNITVTSDNDNPVAVDDIISVNEDASATVIDVLANDSDLDGDTIRVDSVTQPSNGIVTLVNGVVKYIPNANYNGPDSFTYTISDQNGGTNTATVNITVTSDNDNPVAVDDIISVNEDASATVIDVLANDSDLDGDTIRVDSVTQPSNGIVTLVNGVVKYIPNANYNGPDSFTYTISDQNGGTNTATVNITVTSDNDNPVAVDDIISVNEDASATVIDVLENDSDLDGDTIRVDSVTQPSNGIVTLVNGVVKYIPNANYNGPDSFTYTISDQNGGTNTATVNITVTSDNDNPVAVDDIISVNEDASATVIDVLANDSDLDGDTIRVDSVTQPSNGIVTLVNGVVKYIPNANYNGPDSFTYTISDQNGGTNTATVNITVTSDNDNPVAVDDIISVNEDASATVIDVLANDSDLDGDTIRVDSVTQPSNGIVTLVNGVVKYIPNANYNGPDSFTYTISDQNGGTNTATVNITVTSDNDNPVAVDDIISVNEDASATVIDVLENDSDLDGDTIRVDSVTQPSNGIVTLVNGVVKYIPNANYNGPDSFTYTISDQNGGTNTATVNITVTSVEDKPNIEILGGTVDLNESNLDDASAMTVTNDMNYDFGGDGQGNGTVEFSPNQSINLTSEGQNISITTSSDGHTLTGIRADGTEIFEITLDLSSKTYTFTLLESIDHTGSNDEIIKNLNFKVQISDSDGDIKESSIRVNISDDTPSINDDVNTQIDISIIKEPINLIFTLDNSGSMNEERLRLAKEAMINLINTYEEQGHTVLVQLNLFGTTSFNNHKGWMSPSDFEDIVLSQHSQDKTNYDTGLNGTMDNFENPLNGGKTYSYFISDGVPSNAQGDDVPSGEDAVSSNTLNAWNKFLNDNNITSYGVAVGGEAIVEHLERITPEVIHVLEAKNLESALENKAAIASGSLGIDFGEDGPADGLGAKLDGGALAFMWNANDVVVKDANGHVINNLQWSVSDDGLELIAKQGNKEVVKIKASDILGDDPQYEFIYLDANLKINTLKIPFIITDADGDSTSSNVNINVEYNPSITMYGTVDLNESNLDDASAMTVTNDMNYDFGGDGQGNGTVEFSPNQSINLTSEGQNISITTSSDGHTLTGIRADGTEIFEITLDLSSKTYTFTLLESIDHTGSNDEIIKNLNFKVQISDSDGDIKESSIRVNISDDTPSINDDVNTQIDISIIKEPINLIFTLDNSGSMNEERLRLAKEAMINLINTYEEQGHTVLVQLNLFGTTSFNNHKGWMSPSDFEDIVLSQHSQDKTNYDTGLNGTMDNFENPLNGGKTYSYFISDGVPSNAQGDDVPSGEDAVSSNTLNAWNKFLNDNNITSYGVAVGGEAIVEHLERITPEVIHVLEAKNLESALENKAAIASGSLGIDFGEDGPADGLGAKLDGGALAFMWNANDVVVKDANGHVINNLQWSVSDDGLELIAKQGNKEVVKIKASDILGDDPQYEFIYLDNSINITKLHIPFTLTDGDGDSKSSSVNININYTSDATSRVSSIHSDEAIDIDLLSKINDGLLDLKNNISDNIHISLDDILDLSTKEYELKIFGDDSGDKITLGGGSDNWTKTGTEDIDGETFNVYQGINGSSNIKILIDEDVSIEPDV